MTAHKKYVHTGLNAYCIDNMAHTADTYNMRQTTHIHRKSRTHPKMEPVTSMMAYFYWNTV